MAAACNIATEKHIYAVFCSLRAQARSLFQARSIMCILEHEYCMDDSTALLMFNFQRLSDMRSNSRSVQQVFAVFAFFGISVRKPFVCSVFFSVLCQGGPSISYHEFLAPSRSGTHGSSGLHCRALPICS